MHSTHYWFLHRESPADEAYEWACKHRVAVAIRTPILEAAVHAQLAADDSGASDQPLTEEQYLIEKHVQHPTHSSEPVDTDEASSAETDDEEEHPCECDDLTRDFPCWNCILAGRRSLPDS